jgi:putative NADPH-quinone reductase
MQIISFLRQRMNLMACIAATNHFIRLDDHRRRHHGSLTLQTGQTTIACYMFQFTWKLFNIQAYSPMTSARILILYAHPNAEQSRANRVMLDAVRALPHVRIHDLYECYPDFHIDVAYEQTQLREADLVILQHPIHWYSMPALQKEWLDLVLQRGWAFGPNGDALRGKHFWLAATTGGDDSSYQSDARHGHAFSAFLPPYQQTARLCGMHWHQPYLLHDAHHASAAALTLHAARYRALLNDFPDWPASAEYTADSADLTHIQR